MTSDRLHNMKAVEMRTGLSSHLIRIWERRYGAVSPVRSDCQHRLYTEEDVQRLQLMGQLTRSGLAISRIASLSLEVLQTMQEETGLLASPAPADAAPGIAYDLMPDAINAIRRYDTAALEKILDQGLIKFGYSGLLNKLLIPLLHAIGDAWEAGDLTASQEHGATSAMKDYLARNLRSMSPPESAPRLLVTTPAGQLHEMGAAIAASLARKSGWNVTYLGPSLPAEEIVGAVMMNQFRAVALSIIYPGDDPELPGQLIRLRSLLPDDVPIIIGGRSAAHYQESITRIGGLLVGDMADFSRVLDEVRAGKSAHPLEPNDLQPVPGGRAATGLPAASARKSI